LANHFTAVLGAGQASHSLKADAAFFNHSHQNFFVRAFYNCRINFPSTGGKGINFYTVAFLSMWLPVETTIVFRNYVPSSFLKIP
jgi:hypothetical protein